MGTHRRSRRRLYARLTLVNRIGAGPFVGLTVSAALIAFLLIDHFGLLHVELRPLNAQRVLRGLLLTCGVFLIAKF